MPHTRPLAGRRGTFARPLGHLLAVLSARLLGFVPALLVGTGISLVAAGLFNYTASTEAAPDASPTSEAIDTGTQPSFSIVLPTFVSPSGSGAITGGVPTRIVIPALSIDLPVMASPDNEVFPFCGVAEIFPLSGHTQEAVGLNQATYLAAHAQPGMFEPILLASRRSGGASMIGAIVEVYTDDDQNHIYEISEVIRHVPVNSSAFDRAVRAQTDQLWLQTSEGPLSSSTKLQVLALPVGVLAAGHQDAHPAGKARVCPNAPKCTNASQKGCRR
jgi:hypothetical protein